MDLSTLLAIKRVLFLAKERQPNFSEVILQLLEKPTDGSIYVMYHGTTFIKAVHIILTGFHQSEDGMLGRGVYVSRDKSKALRYPLGDKRDQVVLKLTVNIGKVIKIDRQHHPLQNIWHDNGYDTAWVPPSFGMVNSNLEENCVWDPKRIKVVGVEYASQTHIYQCLQALIQPYAQ